MTAVLRAIIGAERCGLVLSRLTPDGAKGGKPKSRGAPPGAPIILDGDDEVLGGLQSRKASRRPERSISTTGFWALAARCQLANMPALRG